MRLSYLIPCLIFFLDLSTAASSIRSDGGGGSSTSSSSSSFSPTPPLLSGAARAAVSTYWVASELLQEHVAPVLRDQIWRPTVRFLREQEEAAIARRLRQKQELLIACPEITQQQKEEQRHVVVTYTPAFVPPPNDSSITVVQALPSRSPLSILLFPIRIAKLSLIAWLLAEALERFGILHEETPTLLRSQVHRVWYDVQPHLFTFRDRIRSTWKQMAPRGLPSLAIKYQFAIGAACGMMASPLLGVAWQPVLLFYGLAEANARAKATGFWSLEHVLNPTLAQKVDQGLDRVRQSLSNLVAPISSSSSQLLLGTTGGGTTRPTYTLGLSSTVTKNATPIQQHDWERHQFLEMIRHGLLVGSIVGLMGKL